MAFKRTYPVTDANDLYVKVLVKCGTCGTKDSIERDDSTELDKVNDNTFHNDTDINAHDSCDTCGNDDWEEYKEHIVLRIPVQLTPKSYTVASIDELIDQVSDFQAKLTTARDNGFALKEVNRDGTPQVVLVKNTD